jgi:hypothetical protein
MEQRSIWPKGWRGLALILVGIVMGATLITPAVAHVAGWTHNWTQHIRPRTDARYYTKTQSNARYLPGGNLPAGATIRGFFGMGWTADAASEFQETYLAFGFTLASAPTAHFIPSGGTPPAGCPGTSANPQADPGHLCVYEDNTGNTTSKNVCSSFGCPGATRWGAQYRASSSAAGTAWTRGTWAVTAPSAAATTSTSTRPSGKTVAGSVTG